MEFNFQQRIISNRRQAEVTSYQKNGNFRAKKVV